ncbi:MAG: histidinol-phosphate transaminase [Planctomycetales bacterium]|nr:histidinol-phosphate transaminase [Planctomycetales bacterium]
MSYVRPAIEAMSGYVPGEQPQAGKFIKLNTNENPYPPSPKVIQAIQAATNESLLRYPDPMATAFRIKAAEVLGVRPDWILCGNGSDDILTICTRAFVGEGQCLRLPYPSYVLYTTLARLQNAAWDEVAFCDDWTLPDAFGQGRDDLRLAFLPNPNSPTGTLISRSRILELAEQLPCPLLVDEAYVDFADANCVDLVARNEKILVSRTLSKSYALAGLRFGFLIAQPQMIEQLTKVKDSYNCDALSIAGATAALDDQAWLEDNRAKVIATRQRLTAELIKMGFGVIPSQANFVWCRHATASSQVLYEQLKANRVLVRYMNYPRWTDGLRISVGTDEQIDALLALLASML